MARLDRSKPFGTVAGVASHRYEQDGRLFDQDGDEMGASKEPVKAAPAKSIKAPAKAESDQVDQQLNG